LTIASDIIRSLSSAVVKTRTHLFSARLLCN